MNKTLKNMRSVPMALLMLTAAAPACAQEVMSKLPDGTCVVRTATICHARGFRNTTPLEVHIRKGKVVKVVALKNEESAPYFARVRQSLLPKYSGIKLSKAKTLSQRTDIDGCTGATYSTKAVQKNVQAALAYYEKHK